MNPYKVAAIVLAVWATAPFYPAIITLAFRWFVLRPWGKLK